MTRWLLLGLLMAGCQRSDSLSRYTDCIALTNDGTVDSTLTCRRIGTEIYRTFYCTKEGRCTVVP